MLERANILLVKADEVNIQLVDQENMADFDVECQLQLNLFIMVEATKARVDNYIHVHQQKQLEKQRLQQLDQLQGRAVDIWNAADNGARALRELLETQSFNQENGTDYEYRQLFNLITLVEATKARVDSYFQEHLHLKQLEEAHHRAVEAQHRAVAAQRVADDAARAFRGPQCAFTPTQTTSHGARPVLHTLVESERSLAFRPTFQQPSRDRVEGQQRTQLIYQEGEQPFFNYQPGSVSGRSADYPPAYHSSGRTSSSPFGSKARFSHPSFEDDHHHNWHDPSEQPSSPRGENLYPSHRAADPPSFKPAYSSAFRHFPETIPSYDSDMDRHPCQSIHRKLVDSSMSTTSLYTHQTGEQSKEFPVFSSEREAEKDFQLLPINRFKEAHHSSVSFVQPDDHCVPNDMMLHHRLPRKRKKEVSLLTSAYPRFHGPVRSEAVSSDQGEFVAPASQLRLFKKRKKKEESELFVPLHSVSGEDVPAE